MRFDKLGQVVAIESDFPIRKDYSGQFAPIGQSQDLTGSQLEIIRRFGLGE